MDKRCKKSWLRIRSPSIITPLRFSQSLLPPPFRSPPILPFYFFLQLFFLFLLSRRCCSFSRSNIFFPRIPIPLRLPVKLYPPRPPSLYCGRPGLTRLDSFRPSFTPTPLPLYAASPELAPHPSDRDVECHKEEKGKDTTLLSALPPRTLPLHLTR